MILSLEFLLIVVPFNLDRPIKKGKGEEGPVTSE